MKLVIESIDGTGTDYEIEVDGEILSEQNTEKADAVTETTASGSVWVEGARDVYQIRGGLQSLAVDGTARVTVDGTPIAGGVRSQRDTSHDAETVEVSIYSSKALLDTNGRVPERTVADFVAGALDNAGFNYDIRYHYPAQHPADETAHCSGDALEWFQEAEIPHESKDSNVLLVNCNGGGCGYVGGNRCTTPGRRIIERIGYEETGAGRIHGSLHANLHEVAHNLGAAHDHNRREKGAQHWGMGYNEGGFWHRTPTVGGNDCTNACGERIEARRYSQVVHHQHFHSCAVENFEIQ